MNWGDPESLRAFLWVVLRGPYVGLEAAGRTLEGWGLQALEAGRTFLWDPFPFTAPLAVAGFVGLWRASRRDALRSTLAFLPVTAAVVAVPRLQRETLHLVSVYLVSLQAIPAALAAAGALVAAARTRPPLRMLFTGGLIAALAVHLALRRPVPDRALDLLPDRFARDVLRGVPRGGVLLGEGDAYVFPLWEARFARGLRKDIVVAPAVFLGSGWGFAQIASAAGLKEWASVPQDFAARVRALHGVAASRGGLHWSVGRELWEEHGPRELFPDPGGLAGEVRQRPPDPTAVRRKLERAALPEGDFSGPAGRFPWATRDYQRFYAGPFLSAGNLFHRAGRLDWAEEAYLRAAEISPREPEALTGLAATYGAAGFPEVAEEFARLGLERDSDHAPAWDNLGSALALQGRRAEAEAAYAECLARNPGWEGTLRNLEALRRGALGATGAGGDPAARLFTFAAAKLREGKPLAAEAAYRALERRGKGGPDLWNDRAVAWIALGRRREARELLDRALSEAPWHRDAARNRILLALEEGDAADARRILERARALRPEDPLWVELEAKIRGPAGERW